MGTDKALLAVDGVPLAVRASDSLSRAGASAVAYVGGDATHVERLEGIHVADCGVGGHTGAGPRGSLGPGAGLVGALGWAPASVLVVVACDLVDLDHGLIARLAGAAATHGAAMPRCEGTIHAHLSAWSTAAARHVRDRFEAGERSLRRLAPGTVTFIEVEPREVWDLDSPDDLTRWSASRTR